MVSGQVRIKDIMRGLGSNRDKNCLQTFEAIRIRNLKLNRKFGLLQNLTLQNVA